MKKKWAYPTVLTVGVLVAAACSDKHLLMDSSGKTPFSNARTAGEPALAVSYEVEEFSFSEIQSLEKKANRAIEDIGAMPRLSRKAIDMRIYADGSFEMTTEQLEPQHKELAPANLQAVANDWAIQKTVVANGVVRFFDRSGKETGQAQKMPTDFATKLLADAKERKAANKNATIADRITGAPKVDKDQTLNEAKKRGAEIKEDNGVTAVKYDLTEAERGGKDQSPKTTVQYYDFKNNRLLGGEVHDKAANKILHKSYIKYKTNADGSLEVEAVRAETYEDDPKTGRKIKHQTELFGNFNSSQLAGYLVNMLVDKLNLTPTTIASMSPEGAYIQGMTNQNTPKPKISIWGSESDPLLWRLAGTFMAGDDEKGISAMNSIAGAYMAFADAEFAMSWIVLPLQGYFNYRGNEWGAGRDWVMNTSNDAWSQLIGASFSQTVSGSIPKMICDYNYYYSGCGSSANPDACRAQCWVSQPYSYTNYIKTESDGVVPANSQRNDGGAWRDNIVRADGNINHQEHLRWDRIEPTLNRIFDGLNNYRNEVFLLPRRP